MLTGMRQGTGRWFKLQNVRESSHHARPTNWVCLARCKIFREQDGRDLSADLSAHNVLWRGYHGTSLDRLVEIEKEGFRVSENDYDWLGAAVYFFQHAPLRAYEWAKDLHGDGAVVLGADIDPIGSMNLLDIMRFGALTGAHNDFMVVR
jgi:hypothetical protein